MSRRVFILASLALLSATGCERRFSTPPAQTTPAGIVLRGVTVRNYRGSTLHLRAAMPTLSFERASTEFSAEHLTAELHNGSSVAAAQALGNANEGRIVGSDGVTMQTTQGIAGSAPTATYERERGVRGGVFGRDGVHLASPQFTVDAKAFTADFETDRVDFEEVTTDLKGASSP